MPQPTPFLLSHLQALEQALLDPKVRQDREAVSNLLTEDFMEFGSSGRMFDKQATLAQLAEEVPFWLSLTEFSCDLLASNIALVTYRAHRTSPSGEKVSSLRSSVWTLEQDCWRMRFHQGSGSRAALQ